jgi:hypothetical protein
LKGSAVSAKRKLGFVAACAAGGAGFLSLLSGPICACLSPAQLLLSARSVPFAYSHGDQALTRAAEALYPIGSSESQVRELMDKRRFEAYQRFCTRGATGASIECRLPHEGNFWTTAFVVVSFSFDAAGRLERVVATRNGG